MEASWLLEFSCSCCAAPRQEGTLSGWSCPVASDSIHPVGALSDSLTHFKLLLSSAEEEGEAVNTMPRDMTATGR